MDVTELHDEENLLVQLQDRWENYGSLDAIVDTHDPFTLEGAPRFELSEKIDSLLSHALAEDENLLLRQTLGMGCKQRSVKSLCPADGNHPESHSEEARHDRRETTVSRRFHRALEISESIK